MKVSYVAIAAVLAGAPLAAQPPAPKPPEPAPAASPHPLSNALKGSTASELDNCG